MFRFSVRMPEEMHAKLRWLAYKQRRSIHAIVMEILVKALADVRVPKEAEEL